MGNKKNNESSLYGFEAAVTGGTWPELLLAYIDNAAVVATGEKHMLYPDMHATRSRSREKYVLVIMVTSHRDDQTNDQS